MFSITVSHPLTCVTIRPWLLKQGSRTIISIVKAAQTSEVELPCYASTALQSIYSARSSHESCNEQPAVEVAELDHPEPTLGSGSASIREMVENKRSTIAGDGQLSNQHLASSCIVDQLSVPSPTTLQSPSFESIDSNSHHFDDRGLHRMPAIEFDEESQRSWRNIRATNARRIYSLDDMGSDEWTE